MGRVSHAYLFALVSRGISLTGDDGGGEATVAALSFAKRLNCEGPPGDAACDACLSCRLVASGNHPDIRVVAPEGLSIKIDQIREIKRETGYRPRRAGGYRVVIVRDAERMTPEAQNSLLRLLEEPPPNTVFLLTTTNPSGLLPTVRSRCQFVRVRAEGSRATPESREFVRLVRRAAGLSPLDVLREAENAERVLRGGDSGGEVRRGMEAALVAAVMWYRDALVLKVTGDAALVTQAADGDGPPGERLSELAEDARSSTTSEMIRVIDRLEEARQQVRKNANTRLVLEAMLFALRAEKSRASESEVSGRAGGLVEREGV